MRRGILKFIRQIMIIIRKKSDGDIIGRALDER